MADKIMTKACLHAQTNLHALDYSWQMDRQQQGSEFIAYHLSHSAMECNADPERKILQASVGCCSNFSAEGTH